jgi:hypothetical protein
MEPAARTLGLPTMAMLFASVDQDQSMFICSHGSLIYFGPLVVVGSLGLTVLSKGSSEAARSR